MVFTAPAPLPPLSGARRRRRGATARAARSRRAVRLQPRRARGRARLGRRAARRSLRTASLAGLGRRRRAGARRRSTNVAAALARAGARPGHVVRTRMYVTDISALGGGRRAPTARCFGDVRPVDRDGRRDRADRPADARRDRGRRVRRRPARPAPDRARVRAASARSVRRVAAACPAPCPPPAATLPPTPRCGPGRSARSSAMRGWRDGPFLLAAAPGRGQDAARRSSSRASCCASGRSRASRVVCPTAPLTRQWAEAAGAARRAPRARRRRAAPAAGLRRRRRHLRARGDGRRERWSRQCARAARSSSPTRRITSARSWPGARASRPAFARRAALAAAVGHAVSLRRRRRSRACATTRRRRRARRHLHLRRRGARRHLPARSTFVPYDGTLQWRSRRRRHRVVVRRRAHRPRGGAPLPHGDLDRARRRPAADPARGARAAASRCAPAGTATPAGSSSPPTARTRGAVAKVLREVTGKRAGRRPAHRGARGARSSPRSRPRREPWIVAVNMVSEGVDIPRLRVGVYATAAKTPLIFRQIVGRFVRTIPGRPAEPSWLYLPGRPGAAPARRRGRDASCATSCARPARRTGALDERAGAARDRARPSGEAFVPRRRRRRAAAGALRRRPGRRRGAVAPAAVPAPGAEPAADGDPSRPGAPGLRAPRAAARQAPPPRRRPAPPRRPQPRRDQRAGSTARAASASVERRDDRAARALDRAAARRARGGRRSAARR